MASFFYSYAIDNYYWYYYQWCKSFRRQETRDRRVPLPSTPPLWVLYFCNMLLLGVDGGICYYCGDLCVSVTTIPLSIRLLVVGGYLFFFKIF